MIKLLIVLCLFILDILTKKLIFNTIDLNNFVTLTFFLDLTHIHNFGISFGLFSGMLSPWVFIFIALIVTGFIFYMMILAKNSIEKWGLIFIITGAISNIFDRLMNGYVIDFIYFHFRDFYWPAFNFADIYISIGICIILFQFLKDLNKRIIK